MAGTDLTISTYSRECGSLIVGPAVGDPGRYDREVLLAAHHRQGEWVSMQDIRRGPPDNGLVMDNHGGDEHPVHLRRQTFEVTRVGDKPTSGPMKDTISMPRFSTAEIDFVPDDPGPTFFHRYHQDHMEEGLAGPVTYA